MGMNRPLILESLFETDRGVDLPLPSELATLYGGLRFPGHKGSPYIISNFVSTLDGVVSLDAQGKPVGDVISGSNEQDSMVMGLLRAVADVVIVGAGTLRASPQHIWTPGYIFPPFADAYTLLRERMGKKEQPLNVIVTAGGNVDLNLPVFRSGKVPVLLVTTTSGARHITTADIPKSVQVVAGSNSSSLTAKQILDAVAGARPSEHLILIEGGPHLMGDFFEEGHLDELFLTVAPQIAGRESSLERMGIVEGRIFSPDNPLWGTLVSVKRAGNHLFLRYAFQRKV